MTSERLVVIGHPIAHSLSPPMHRAALAALGLGDRVSYEARDVPPAELAAFVEELRDGRWLGANVTLPHKRAVMSLCDRLEASAREIGAVNTLVRDAGGAVVGTNTDAPGLTRALAEAGVEAAGRTVLVLGAGGAARAAVVACRGAARVLVAARRIAEATALVSELGASEACALDAVAIGALAGDATLVIQATSATLDPVAGAALAAVVPWSRFPRSTAVCDLVYRPRRTAVLAAAEAAGLATIDGLGMLVHQGALALERWLGVTPPVGPMRAALNGALASSFQP